MAFRYVDRTLACQGIFIKDLVRDFGSPLYVYDLDEILSRLTDYKKAFRAGTQVHFALKCNSNRKILKALAEAGAGVDVVSGGELSRALECGFSPSEIVFSGVGKSVSEISLALESQVKLINVESLQELERIGRLASEKGLRANIGFRLNPQVDAKTHPYITTGLLENKFGLEISILPELELILEKFSENLDLISVGFHIGSQLTELSALNEAAAKIKVIYEDLHLRWPKLTHFDVGGGLGIAYQRNVKGAAAVPGIADYVRAVTGPLADLKCHLICEPGRSIVGHHGILVAEVEYVKKTSLKNFAIVNTGMHHLLRPALYKSYHEIITVEERDHILKRRYDVVGPICESSDIVGAERELPELEQGDLVAICDAGAYGYSMASRYNLHALPKEIVLSSGQVI